jgi:ubiquinone/menaquinone biosynthesis C-methylase UbiE
MSKFNPSAVNSDKYTREYYENCCDGAKEFLESNGKNLPHRLKIILELAKIQKGQKILDIGCGRGELAFHGSSLGAQVWSIDYSSSALAVARDALLNNKEQSISNNLFFMQADARTLPFMKETFDLAFMLDVVEHLTPDELDNAFQEVKRVLHSNGYLFIHTMPNLWYYKGGYKLFRFIQAVRGNHLPPDPRDRWAFKDLHVNEQTPLMLWRKLRKNGFQAKVWLRTTQSYEEEKNKVARLLMKSLVRLPIIKLIFCNDIFAIAKRHGK